MGRGGSSDVYRFWIKQVDHEAGIFIGVVRPTGAGGIELEHSGWESFWLNILLEVVTSEPWWDVRHKREDTYRLLHPSRPPTLSFASVSNLTSAAFRLMTRSDTPRGSLDPVACGCANNRPVCPRYPETSKSLRDELEDLISQGLISPVCRLYCTDPMDTVRHECWKYIESVEETSRSGLSSGWHGLDTPEDQWVTATFRVKVTDPAFLHGLQCTTEAGEGTVSYPQTAVLPSAEERAAFFHKEARVMTKSAGRKCLD